LRLILPLLALAILVGCDRQKAQDQQGNGLEAGAEAGPVKGVDRSRKGEPAPDVPFLGPDGGETRLTELRGPMLVNFWATWCAPCVKELPTLDALSRRQGETGGLAVIAMNQDMAPQGSIEDFFVKLQIKDLGFDQDPKMALSGALGVQVLPTTILFDAAGREVWRYVGDLDWTGEEAQRLLSEAK
jgi:thiol-disulfide isomerase/thioredoxin